MSLDNKDKNYVSEDDLFFHNFDKNRPKSLSQQQEILKAERIAEARDNPNAGKAPDELWEGF